MEFQYSLVEQVFLKESGIIPKDVRLPYVVTDSVPRLGLLSALRFLEWVCGHPKGVVCLPTGKSAKYFIDSVRNILDRWDTASGQDFLKPYGLAGLPRPSMHDLQLVQMNEFYPIAPTQHNSFYHFMNETYIKGLGFDPDKALLMNCDKIHLAQNLPFAKVFPDLSVDLSLRYRTPQSALEDIQQQSIFLIDDWCSNFERQIQARGGIGFFLSPIGSDGRIAFNVKGSNHGSNTQLTPTNFATQADSAGDLGGISVSKQRLVITIGLGTITKNADTVAIVYSAGETNAPVVKASLEKPMMTMYPATALQSLPNARFYLTTGSASRLEDSIHRYFQHDSWNFQKTERAVIGLCKTINRYAHRLTIDDLKNDSRCSQIPNLSLQHVNLVIDDVKAKLMRGAQSIENEVILHTGPHHDDIMLGIMPFISRQLRSASNDVHFAIGTSGYNSVTNEFLIEAMSDTIRFLQEGRIEMVQYADFFTSGYQYKYDKDVYHYLDNVARKNADEMRRGFCHRLLRDAVGLWNLHSVDEVIERFNQEIKILRGSYDGEPNSHDIQTLKGYIREFEEELVWAYAGTPIKNIHHLRLGFYHATSKKEFPDYELDVMPVLSLLRSLNPTMITVTIDPEGMGPDTHYKVLQTVAAALRIRSQETDLSHMKVIGYRNVWSQFNPSEADVYVPVTLNSFAVIEKAFHDSYLTQVKAEFPSPYFDGSFSELAENTWVKQLRDIQLVLGKDYFYENSHPLIRATHGLIFLKEMDVNSFVTMAEQIKKVNTD